MFFFFISVYFQNKGHITNLPIEKKPAAYQHKKRKYFLELKYNAPLIRVLSNGPDPA